ncbi:MAG TPA: protein kinase, partial [Chroococcales cyanobacterium]
MPAFEADTALQPGELIAGRYEIVSLIGAGGMGVVYKAKQPLLDKFYAVKVMTAEQSNSTAWRRFHTEAKAMCDLRHQNLISVYDMDFHKERPFLVMDFVDGTSLADYLAERGT